jgi:hypothetical protein
MGVDIRREYGRSNGAWSRRRFLKGLMPGAATLVRPNYLKAQQRSGFLGVSDTVVAAIPEGFTGLSYESAQLSDPLFFSPDNRALGNLFRMLGSRGVLRLGGNSSELGFWQSMGTGAKQVPPRSGATGQSFSITSKAIDNLAGFLKTVDWKLVYGLNLGSGDTASAVEEAVYVSRAVGERLLAFQFGNEPDMLAHPGDATRRWTYEEFIARWKQYYAAIRARLPTANIAGPDAAYKQDWVARFASDTRGNISLLTAHYYAEGPPTDPRMTIDYLLHTARQFDSGVLPDIRTAKQTGLRYRMSEGNTCYSGGKAGVSNTFASALWVLDFMLSVAAAGGSGVNLHGGGNGLYTPIAGSMQHGFSARPIYYGMLAAGQVLGGNLVATDLDSRGSDVQAYASSTATGLRVVVINREASPISIQLKAQRLRGRNAGSVWRLQAPSISSSTGVTLSGASGTPEGILKPSTEESLALNNGECALQLDPYSAALVVVNG